MRMIDTHKVNPANDVINLSVLDEPGSGGACHDYHIDVPGNASSCALLRFQNGPIAEAGVNGITHEVLLAVLIDRLEHFQAGPFASHHNAEALRHLEQARDRLLRRTLERVNRGVEGTHTV